MPIVLTSCGVINEDFKEKFFALFSKPIEDLRMLYITTAADGESGDKSWVGEEYQRILALGFRPENIMTDLHLVNISGYVKVIIPVRSEQGSVITSFHYFMNNKSFVDIIIIIMFCVI